VAKLYVRGVFGPSLALDYFLSIDSARSVTCFCSAYNIAFSAGELQLDVVFSTLSNALFFFNAAAEVAGMIHKNDGFVSF